MSAQNPIPNPAPVPGHITPAPAPTPAPTQDPAPAPGHASPTSAPTPAPTQDPAPAPGHASPASPRLRAALWVYKRILSPLLHGISGILSPVPVGCRFLPTCSEYAYVALERHGILRGLSLATWRLLRCHPFARGGFDPVPPARHSSPVAAHPATSNSAARRK